MNPRDDDQERLQILQAFYDGNAQALERAMIEALFTALLEGTIDGHARFSDFIRERFPTYWDDA